MSNLSFRQQRRLEARVMREYMYIVPFQERATVTGSRCYKNTPRVYGAPPRHATRIVLLDLCLSFAVRRLLVFVYSNTQGAANQAVNGKS